jgi:hypothetical protein
MKVALFFFISILPLSLNGKEKSLQIITHNEAGFFSAFQHVMIACDHYDKGFCKGLEINFETSGLYYTPSHGANWWTYYFLPIKHGKIRRPLLKKFIPKGRHSFELEYNKSREECFNIIQKYIFLRPEIQKIIDDFYNEHFLNHFVISVHYRGTDKTSEAPRVSYEAVISKILEVIEEHPNKNISIFVATDEQPFLDYLINYFGDAVFCNQTATRSVDGTPLHFNPTDPYQSGLEALLDCILLSKGNILIRTSSNLSLCSSFFNKEIPVIELSERFKPSMLNGR